MQGFSTGLLTEKLHRKNDCNMPTTCVVCAYRFVKGDGTKIHVFPPEQSLRQQWLTACSLDAVNDKERICGKHFRQDDYKESGRLKPGIVPSVFTSTTDENSPKIRKRPPLQDHSFNTSSSSDDSILSEDGSKKRRIIQPKVQASPTKEELKLKVKEQKRKIKTLNQKLRRKCSKIETLEGMYQELSERRLLSDEFSTKLKEKFPGMSAEIISNHFSNYACIGNM